MAKYWVWPVDEDGWNTLSTKRLWATRFKSATSKISRGDQIIFYIMGARVFRGIFEVVSDWYVSNELVWTDESRQGAKLWPYEIKIRPLKTGQIPLEGLTENLEFIAIKSNPGLSLQATHGPANHGKPIGESDYRLILGGMGPEEGESPPSHKELVEMLRDLGKTLGFIAKSEDSNGLYRHDVTWRDFEGHSPKKAFEVEMSGNLDHALSSLTHASHRWRPDQLYLVIADEKDMSRVDSLVGPRISGAFSEIAPRLKVLTWADVKKLYHGIKPHENLIRDLAKR